MVIILSTLGLFFGLFNSWETFWIVFSAGVGMCSYFGLVNFMRAVVVGKIGVVLPIVDLSVVVSALCAFIFLGQSISSYGLLFMLVILLGAVVLSVDFTELKKGVVWEAGTLYACLASCIWGIEYFIRTFPVQHIGSLSTSILIEIGVFLAACIHLFIVKRQSFFDKVSSKIYATGFVIACFASVGTLGINMSIAAFGGPLTFAILGGRPAVSALIGYFYFKESLTLKQILAVLLIIIGVVGVALLK
jgi:threonine/homoserine efflux transporter RhtA